METALEMPILDVHQIGLTPERMSGTVLAQRALAVLRCSPAGLITDVDGTISPIAPTPSSARVLPVARAALRRLRSRVALVAVVSGRSVPDARRMVRVGGAAYIGNHGYEYSHGTRCHVLPEARPWIPRISATLAAVRRMVECQGMLFEDKGATASIHYRLCPDPEATRNAVLGAIAWSAQGRDLKVEEGRMVVNLLPPLAVDKGTGVRTLISKRQLRGLVYLGDDVTDTHAFRALADVRRAGQVRTLTVAVGNPTWAADIHKYADTWVPSVDYAAALLDYLASALGQVAPAASLPTRLFLRRSRN